MSGADESKPAKRRRIGEEDKARFLAPVHSKQVLTYLRLMDLPLGLLMNFGGGTFREGIRRVANYYDAPDPARITVSTIV